MKKKFSFITLWKLNDWGIYNRRDEALLRELSRREDVGYVLHVEHAHIKGIILRIFDWITEKSYSLKNTYAMHLRKAFALRPVDSDGRKRHFVYSVVVLYSGNNAFLRGLNDRVIKWQYDAINRFSAKSGHPVVLIAYFTTGYLEGPISAIRHDFFVIDFEDEDAERRKDEEERRRYRSLYRRLLPQCDCVFANCNDTIRKYSGLVGRNIEYLPNAVDLRNFRDNAGRKVFGRRDRKAAGYVGILNREVDFSLLEHLLLRFPAVDFILIGRASAEQAGLIRRLSAEFGNFFFLGERSYQEVPGYLSQFDVLLALKKNDDSTAGGESQKIYEYLATGKPVVTTSIPPADKFAHLLYVADDKERFAQLMEKALREEDPELAEIRRKVAAENTWEKRADIILDRVHSLLREDHEPVQVAAYD